MPDSDLVNIGDIVIFIILLLLSAFFSASKTALFTAGRHRLASTEGNYLDVLIAEIRKDPHRLLSTIMIGNTAVDVAATCFAALTLNTARPQWSFAVTLAVAIVCVTVLIFFFGKLLPKTFAASHDILVSHVVILPLYWLSILLMPLIAILRLLPNADISLQQGTNLTEEELINIVEAVEEEGGIDEDEKEFIHNIFKFNDTTADEIMTPRGDMFAVNLNDSPDLKAVLESGFSRIPVIEGEIDNVIGILHIKDLFQHAIAEPQFVSYSKVMRTPYFVPGNKKINELFAEFNQRKQHLAIVVDEYGGVSGLITQEDILEEIVGEIVDETDEEKHTISEIIPGQKWKIAGKTEIEEVEEAVGLNIPEDHEYETFSGYVLEHIGRIPAEKEVLHINQYIVTVDKVEGNRVSEYTLELAAEAEPVANSPE